MSRITRSMAAAAVAGLALSGTTLWAAPAKATARSVNTSSAKAPATKAQSLVGTLQKVEGQTLTIQTTKGQETVMLAPSAQIHHGSKTLTAADLSAQTGARVKVRYSEKNGQKQAQSVRVSSAPGVTQTAHATTSSKAPAKASKK